MIAWVPPGPLWIMMFWRGMFLKGKPTWPTWPWFGVNTCPPVAAPAVATGTPGLRTIWGVLSKLLRVITPLPAPNEPNTWMCWVEPLGSGDIPCSSWPAGNAAVAVLTTPTPPPYPPETSWEEKGTGACTSVGAGWESSRASWASVCSVMSASRRDFWRMSKGWSSPRSTSSGELPVPNSSSMNERLLESWRPAPAESSPKSPSEEAPSLRQVLELVWKKHVNSVWIRLHSLQPNVFNLNLYQNKSGTWLP